MIQKGSAIPIKKGLGIFLIVIGLAHVFNITQILSFIEPYEMIAGIVIAISGYFLLISGRQR